MTKEIDVVREKQPAAKSIGEERAERLAAIEQDRKDREKPRDDYMRTGKGDAKQFVDVTTNRDAIESFTGQSVHEEVEDLSESAREKWLRTGELPEKKPNGKAADKKAEAAKPERPKLADFVKDGQTDNEAYERALDKYETDKTAFEKQQAAKQNEAPTAGELDKETFEEFKSERQDFWNEPEHTEAHKTLPDRMVRVIQALTPAEKQILATSPVKSMKLHGDLNGYLMHTLSRVKNLGRVLVVLNKDVQLMERLNADYAKTEGNSQKRFESQQAIRYVLKYIDKQVAKMSDEQWHGKAGSANGGNGASTNGARREIKDNLTRAGRPPLEAAGSSSSPADDGSSEAAWRRKDLSMDARGELYRERKNQEEIDARRKRFRRR